MNKLFISLVFIVISGCYVSDSAIVISGRVYNVNNEPLENVVIDLAGRKLVSDSEGRFCYDSIYPDISVSVSADKIGYLPLSKEFDRHNYELVLHLAESGSNEDSASTISVDRLPDDVAYDFYCQ